MATSLTNFVGILFYYASFLITLFTVGKWGDWATCSKTCGTGMSSRSRECSSEEPDQDCNGNLRDYRQCLLEKCGKILRF